MAGMGLFMRRGGGLTGELPRELAGGEHAGIGGWAGVRVRLYRDLQFGAVPPAFF